MSQTHSVTPHPNRPGGDPSLTVSTHHMPEGVQGLVADWFAGRISEFRKSGDRSVYIPYEHGDYTHIKIKGAGMRGGGIQFGTYLRAGPDAPIFDFDGRRMLDVAFGHDGAFVGGASRQQSVTEWRMSQLLPTIGFDVIPCLGYGSVSHGDLRSWFTVYQWNDAWIESVQPPNATIEVFEAMTMQNARDALSLALEHNLVGYFWRVRDDKGRHLLKDLHPFRKLDPLNYSKTSWVMQVYHALHMTSVSNFLLASYWHGEERAREAGLWMIRPFLPEVTLEDWDLLRFRVVAKYMNNEPEHFQPHVLEELLHGNPITAKLLEMCPAEFVD